METRSGWSFNPFIRASKLKAPTTSLLPPMALLCYYCKLMFSSEAVVRPRFFRPYQHFHQTFEELVESANADCRICAMRLKLLSSKDRDTLEGSNHVHFNVFNEHSNFTLDDEQKSGHDDLNQGPFDRVCGIDFEYCPVDEKDELKVQSSLAILSLQESKPYISDMVAREASNNSQTSKDIADFWLNSCRQDHDECRSFPITGAKPKRVLDLGQGKHISPRLCMTKNLPASFKYATLSHVWGRSQPLRLVMASYDAMQEGLDVSLLPQNFRDAMEVSRRLGVRYIWIDSLCILQDSEVDWQEQARDMGDIYQNAEVNIAAARPLESEGLFFYGRKSRAIPCVVEAKWTNAKNESYSISSSFDWHFDITESPLLSRAWVTQELVLARRVLYFAEGQMFWECYQRQANEMYPQNIPLLTGRKLTTNPEYVYGRMRLHDEKQRPFREYLLWDLILQRYTAAELTFPEKDKLIAIASVGQKLGIYDELIAGLWRKRLPYQLLWRIMPPASRPVQWQAPSWSWASVNGKIDPQVSENYFLWQPTRKKQRQEDILIRVVDIAMAHQENDTRKRLLSASLQLWGPMVQGKLRKEDTNPDSTLFRFGTENVLVQFRHDEFTLPDIERAYTLILVLHTLDEGYPEYYGLWIEPSELIPGQWVRIGFCNIIQYIWKGNIDNFERMLKRGLKDVSNVHDIDFTNKDTVPRYLISLV
ncbi:HET-domain-containing protein [Microthyrium microscopicum]|uniref:HET-domain-containing protein n=1 Tax=Microthyrium microscopicum TaxID=703497 RepID=A0A6A6UGG6_9PEZI|nr:HET-domain-containing protein [Microthyrium microscopicum]